VSENIPLVGEMGKNRAQCAVQAASAMAKLSAFLLSAVLLAGFLVTAVPALAAPEPAAPQAEKKRSFKGWELYSWQEGTEWRYSLLPGTNRLKFESEIKNPKTSRNLKEIEAEINQLASSEWLTWEGRGRDQKATANCALAYPPRQTVLKLRALCARIGLHENDSFETVDK
jgi:hypothetical protein